MSQTLIVALAASVVFAVCVVLVLHRHYPDGIIGRVGLAMIGIAALARVLGIAGAGWTIQFNSIAFFLWIGLAVFLSRHLYRFLRWRSSGEHAWPAAQRAATAGKG